MNSLFEFEKIIFLQMAIIMAIYMHKNIQLSGLLHYYSIDTI